EGWGGQWQTSDFEDRLAHLKEELFSSEEHRDELRKRLGEKERALEELRRRLGLPPEERRRLEPPPVRESPAESALPSVPPEEVPRAEAESSAPVAKAQPAPPPAPALESRPLGKRKVEAPPPPAPVQPEADLVLEEEPPAETTSPAAAAPPPAKKTETPHADAARAQAAPPPRRPTAFGSFIPEPTPLKSTATLSQGSSFDMPAPRPMERTPVPPPAAASANPPPFPTMDIPAQMPQAELSPPAFLEPSTLEGQAQAAPGSSFMEPISPPAFVEPQGGGVFQPPPSMFDQPQTMIYSGGAPGGLFGGNPGAMPPLPAQGGEVTLPGFGAPAPTEGGWGTAQIQGPGGLESPATPIPITNPASFPQPIPLFEGQADPYGEGAAIPFPQESPMATLGGSPSTSGGSLSAVGTAAGTKAKPKHSKGFLIALVASFVILTGVAVVFLRNPKDLIMLISMSPEKKTAPEDAMIEGSGAPPAAGQPSRAPSGAPAQSPSRSPFPASPPVSPQAPAAASASPAPQTAPAPPPAQQAAAPPARGHDFIQDDGAHAIEFVKNYKISKERGTVGQVLQYYFLSADNKDEWLSGAIEANVFWVTYRVFQSGKKESGSQPINYLFEVDLAKGALKGTNPASKELLGGTSSKPSTRPAAAVRKKSPPVRSQPRPAPRSRPAVSEDPEPLPDEEELVSARPKKSSGFNNPGADSVELTP
ncbi:MAG: hypothetical protein AAB412_06965, partial [Elusimicrobiota bacterium]